MIQPGTKKKVHQKGADASQLWCPSRWLNYWLGSQKTRKKAVSLRPATGNLAKKRNKETIVHTTAQKTGPNLMRQSL